MRIDPEILNLLPRWFVEQECQAHGVESIEANHFLWACERTPGSCKPRKKEVLLDPSTDISAALEKLRRLNAAGLELREKEFWCFVFLHECRHCSVSQGMEFASEEWACDYYAIKTIRELRERYG